MKALDKIYIPLVDLGEDGLCQAPIWWNKNKQDEKPECKGTIEYIRKNALLEWAESLWKTHLPGQTVIKYLIDKLNSM